MSKKTTSTSESGDLPIRKMRGKATEPRMDKTNAEVAQPTLPTETPASGAVEKPTTPEAAPALREATTDAGNVDSAETPMDAAEAAPSSAEAQPAAKKNKKGKKQPKPTKISAINAAAKVLADA